MGDGGIALGERSQQSGAVEYGVDPEHVPHGIQQALSERSARPLRHCRRLPDRTRAIPENPHGGREHDSYNPCQPEIRIPRKVTQGQPARICARPITAAVLTGREPRAAGRYGEKLRRISVCHSRGK